MLPKWSFFLVTNLLRVGCAIPSKNGSCARFPGDIIAVILVIIELRYEFLCASLKLGGDLKLLIEILLVLTHRARQAVVGRGR